MKRNIFIYSVLIAIFVCFLSCENLLTDDDKTCNNGNSGDGSNIVKTDPVVDWTFSIKGISGQKLKTIPVPCNHTDKTGGTFTWTKPDTLLGNMRKQTYNLTFTPKDTSHYNIVTKDVEITVIPLNMVKIPAGNFLMGTSWREPYYRDNESPQHKVTLDGFSMSEYMVTQELYEVVMGKNPSYHSYPIKGESETPEQLPVESVSWHDVLIFCNKLSKLMGLTPAYSIQAFNNSTDPLDWGKTPKSYSDPNLLMWDTVRIVPGSTGYRMPTEAQWEYACRAGTTTAYYTGNTANYNTGWYDDESNTRDLVIHKVGLLPANPWGLYDMHGNLWEWCWDRYVDTYYDATQFNPMGPYSGIERVLRGGFYADVSDSMRSAFRIGSRSWYSGKGRGFRIVLP